MAKKKTPKEQKKKKPTPPEKASEVVYTDKLTISCDGGTGELEHPRVYLPMGEEGSVECPYCSQVFVLKE
ncbi:MAG: zinc-finger domain-containing protein [Alphaproteobacteria bacterium]|jgi:uncharacterized Zn-finger protein|nr:zinc-finger domain-containing protein [Alphaproteobacteria bacterium]MBT5654806.1 zinc-finger domain-containing protein [Alphaproteobacteria bacterium]